MYGGNPGPLTGVRIGSGQFDTPWARTQRAKLTSSRSWCWDALGVAWPPSGSRRRQAASATWNCVLLTPSSCALTFANPSGIASLDVASGYRVTPWVRMQLEKASARAMLAEGTPVCGPLPDESPERGVGEPLGVVLVPS